MSCGAETEANALMASLLAGVNVDIPDLDLTGPAWDIPNTVDLTTPITKVKIADLTTKVVDGNGTFDVVMKSLSVHLKEEFEKSRITGAEYSKAYTSLVEVALATGTQFLLQKDQAYWASQLAQIQTITARVQLATAKLDYAGKRAEVLTIQANYALAKMKLATESSQYCLLKNELESLRPLQAAGVVADNTNKTAQLNVIKEQAEAQRGQTSNTRMDGVTPIAGTLGKQRDLYEQQITSYKQDAKYKVTKLFSDVWMTQKTMDEGLIAPTQFQNAAVDSVVSNMRTEVGLG